MNQTKAIHQALKRLIRRRGYTYADAAKILKLSEASIKRLFASNGLSLIRLEQLCDWLRVDIADVVELSGEEQTRSRTTRLTAAQEQTLVENIELILLSHLVLNHWSKEEILTVFNFTEPQLFQHLVQIEKLGLIELLPFDRIKPRVARNFAWHPDGPVQQFFAEQVLPEFLQTRFAEPGEHMRFVSGLLSRTSVLKLHQLLDELSKTFDDLVQADIKLPAGERYGVSLFLGLRPWEFSGFTALRRGPRTKFF